MSGTRTLKDASAPAANAAEPLSLASRCSEEVLQLTMHYIYAVVSRRAAFKSSVHECSEHG